MSATARILSYAAVLAAVALASCATLERYDVAAPAQGGAVAMRTDTALVVNLPPDPSNGGHTWVLRSASPNLALIGGPDFTPAPKPPGLAGAPDTTTFRFRATAAGPGALEFVWTAPPGQPPVSPERVVRYEVAVGPVMRLATDYFGTLGMQSARPAGNSTMGAPVTAPSGAQPDPATPAGSGGAGAPSAVKYWSF